jgi:hypothetical protein
VSSNPFIAPYEHLPDTLPIFPLPGAIVMPGSELPLNIFEPRYLNMISDVLATHRMIGMIQPDTNAADGSGLYRTGCAGRITQYRETADGRIELVLTGVCRFDISEELPTTRGYRMVLPQWARFSGDYSNGERLLATEHRRLLQTLKGYFHFRELDIDWMILERLSTMSLLNSMTMALPLGEEDKQVLLETVLPAERLDRFLAILDSEITSPGKATRH